MKAKPCKKVAPKAKAKTSCKKKNGLEKSKLTKKNLSKLPQMFLQEKLKKAGEEEDPEQAKAILQELMTKEEKNKLWGKHTAAMKNNKEEREAYNAASKKEKSDMSLMWLLKKEVPKFMHISREVSGETSAKRKEKYVSELEMLNKWTWEELQMRLASGRIVARECAATPGVWEYCDMQNWSRTHKATTSKKAKFGQEFVPNSDDGLLFDEWANANVRNNAAQLCNSKPGKGLGKSSIKGAGKGLGKSQTKGKGKRNQLALTNGEEGEGGQQEEPEEEETEEEKLKEALKKAKKARDLTTALCADFEDCLAKANPFLTKAAKQNGLKDQQVLVAMGNKLKDVVKKENLPLNKLMALLQENANKIKDVKDTMKEMKQLANKANSIASKASSSKGKK